MNLHRVVLGGLLVSGALLCQIHVPTAMGQVRPRVSEAVDDAQRITLKGNVHPLARAEFDRGAVAESQPINRILLLLKRSDEQEAALQDALGKLQDKSSPTFHQWLTPEQFGAQFGPADADVQAVTDWLTRQGFAIGKIYSGKTVIEFSGSAGQLQRAFGTAIHSYQVNGKTYSANASDPQIPAALAPVVTGIVSLHNFPRDFYARRFGTLRIVAGKSVAEPLVTLPNEGPFYGVGPGDFAKIYGVPATCGNPATACTGTGQTIAIVGETNLAVSDVQQFRSVFGLPATFDANSIVYNGEDPGITSTDEEAEADLDTQWSGGVAPGATIKYVLSASTPASQGVDLSALYIVEHNLAAVMSESYGACEGSLGTAENSFVNSLWQQAAAQGITVAVSTGDSGSAGCDDPNQEGLATHSPAVSGLASTPYNVAVGGTDFDEFNTWLNFWNSTNDSVTGASAKGYIPEIPWNQSCAQLGPTGCNVNTTPFGLQNIVAGAGGPSLNYSKPSWQIGTAGMPSDGKRDLPDVSLLASPGFNGTGYLYCQSDAFSSCSASGGFSGSLSFGIIGGTSASAPAFAGIMALINQSQATAQNPAPRQGNANYVLYALAHKAGASCVSATPVVAGCVFNDVTKGSSALPTGGTAIAGTISVPCRGGVVGCSATLSSQIGVLDDPNKPGTLAWNAGAGYDRATGLGSLNVGNLAAQWGTVATVPTTTTLTLSPTTGITHGSENVTATISVTPKSGAATGVVSLIAKLPDGTTFGAGEFTLGANGGVSGKATNLPGGSNYPVYAHYSGDGTNAPSDSTPVSVTVAQEKSSTFVVIPLFDSSGNLLNGNTASWTYGALYFLRMYVTNGAGVASPSGPPSPLCASVNLLTCPTGTVTITSDGQPIDQGTYHLNSAGYTRDLVPNLPGGTHTIVAQYSGDSSYQSSTSASVSVSISPAATQLSSPFGWFGLQFVATPITLNTNVTPYVLNGAAPSGTIIFYDGGTAIPGKVSLTGSAGTQYTPANLQATQTTTFSASGSHAITAIYSGDANYGGVTSQVSNLSVFYPTTIGQSESSQTINYGQSVTLTATATSSSKNPPMTGTFTFQGYVTPIPGPVTPTLSTDANGNQVLTASVTTVPQGSEFILVGYSGDANYAPGQTNGAEVTVNIPDFTLTSPNALSTTVGQSGSATLTIAPVSNTPSTVTVSVAGGAPPGTTLTMNPATVNLAGAPVQVMLTLSTLGAAPGATAVKPQFRKASTLGVAPRDWWGVSLASAVALFFLIGMPERKRRYRMIFSLAFLCVSTFAFGCGGGGGSSGGGGGGGGGGNSTTPTSITISSSSTKIAAGGTATLTANVTATQAITGGVVFYQNGTAISSVVPVANSQATFTLNNPIGSPAIYTFSARFNGDSKNQPSSTATGVNEEYEGSVPLLIQATTGTLTHSALIQISLQ